MVFFHVSDLHFLDGEQKAAKRDMHMKQNVCLIEQSLLFFFSLLLKK